MMLAHRIALNLNNVQTSYFAKAAGTARFAYNWALTEWQRQDAVWEVDHSLPRPSESSLRRQLNAIKREQFPWMLEVTKSAPQMAIIQLGEAFKRFDWDTVKKKLKSQGVELLSAGLDESPGAYKDIEQVMADQADLVEILAEFQPKIVKMDAGGRGPNYYRED